MRRDRHCIDACTAASIDDHGVGWEIFCCLLGGDLIRGLLKQSLSPKPIPWISDFAFGCTLSEFELRLEDLKLPLRQSKLRKRRVGEDIQSAAKRPSLGSRCRG